MEDRFNTQHTNAIDFSLFGHSLLISQDPNSKHVGTTVWDSSVVFTKFLERNCRKGEFCKKNLLGKRAVELGAGCGLSGLGMALLGCDVTVTDQVEILPLLSRNIDRNLSRVKQATSVPEGPLGSIQVAELSWGNQDHIVSVEPPFDYIIGTDIIYIEHLLEPLVTTIKFLAGPKTTVVLVYEFRSAGVDEKLHHLFKEHFDIKKVPRKKMDPSYYHENIQILIMRCKRELLEIC